MEIDNLIQNTIIDPDGTVFELTDDLQKWGYVIKRNGGVDKKWNQAMRLFTGRDGLTYSQDNNGTTLVWKNGQWNYHIKDNKSESEQFYKSVANSPARTTQSIVSQPSTVSKPVSIAEKLGIKVSTQAAPVIKSTTAAVNEMLAKDELPPPESTLAAPMSGQSPLYMQEMLPDTKTQTTAAPTSLQAKGFLSSPVIMAAMVAAVILMVVIARKKSAK